METYFTKVRFEEVFNDEKIPEVPFSQNWSKEEYLDLLVTHDFSKDFKQGDIIKTKDEAGRKILVIVCPKGNVVVYELYTPLNQFSVRLPIYALPFFPRGHLGEYDMYRLLGQYSCTQNFINTLFNAAKTLLAD